MESFESQPSNTNSLINSEVKGYFYDVAKWTNFLSKIGLICIGLIMGFAFTANNFSVFIVYVIIAVIGSIPIRYLFNFSKKVKQGLQSDNVTDFAEGIRNLKSHYKFTGILTIVYLVFFIIVMAGGLSKMILKYNDLLL